MSRSPYLDENLRAGTIAACYLYPLADKIERRGEMLGDPACALAAQAVRRLAQDLDQIGLAP